MKRSFVAAVALVAGATGSPAWADETGPEIVHVPVAEAVEGRDLVVRATMIDPSGIFQPALYVRARGMDKYSTIPMKAVAEEYQATIPAGQVAGVIEYFIEAFDTLGNGPSQFGKPDAPLTIVAGPAPAPPPPLEGAIPPAVPPPVVGPPPEEAMGPVRTPVAALPPVDAEGETDDDDSVLTSWWLWSLIGVAVAGAAIGVTYVALDDGGSRDTVAIEFRGPNPGGQP